jgi:tRNA(Ile2) C34 agmatinyltransferase TiaS
MDHRQPVFQFNREVCMELMMRQSARAMADVMSGILNLVCPDCGGRLGGPGKEFRCQGKCQTDWRQVWEGLLSSEISGDQRKASRSS